MVSNYGFAFTNQFSRCSAINFRANWDICCCSGVHITSHHFTSHQGRQEGTKGLHHNNWCGQTCDLPSLGFDLFKQVKVLEERTHLMTHQWCGTSKDDFTRKSYSRMIDTEDSVKVPRYDFLFLTITFQTFINLYHPDPKWSVRSYHMYFDILTTLTYWKPLKPAINMPVWLFQTSYDALFPNVAAAYSWQNLSPQGRPETEHAVQQVLTPKSNQRKPHQLPKRILICCQESRESFVFGQ